MFGDFGPLQQIGGDLGCDLVVPGQVGDCRDLLNQRDRAVDPLVDHALGVAEEAGHAGPDRIQRLLNRIE